MAEGNTLGKGPVLFHIPQVPARRWLCGAGAGAAVGIPAEGSPTPAPVHRTPPCAALALSSTHARTWPAARAPLQSAMHLVKLRANEGDPGAALLRLQLLRMGAAFVTESCESGGWGHGVGPRG